MGVGGGELGEGSQKVQNSGYKIYKYRDVMYMIKIMLHVISEHY